MKILSLTLLSFLFSTLVLEDAALASSATEIREMIAALDLRATKVVDEPSLRSPIGTLAEAYELIVNGHLQEAVWSLREAHETDLAGALEAKIKSFLLSATVEAAVDVPDNGRVKRLWFDNSENGISAIFTANGNLLRVLAYELDVLLRLDVVPVTISENGKASLQYYMAGAKDGGGGGFDFFAVGYSSANERFNVLDFLLGMRDRHGNWLKSVNGRQIAIGNEKVYLKFPGTEARLQSDSQKWKPRQLSPELIQRIASLDPQQVIQRLSAYAPEATIQYILARLNDLKGFYPVHDISRHESARNISCRDLLTRMPGALR